VYANGNPNTPWKFSVNIQNHCEIGQVCGTYNAPQTPCSGNLTLIRIDQKVFIFSETQTGGLNSCISGNYEFMRLISSNQLYVSSGPYPDPAKAGGGGTLTK